MPERCSGLALNSSPTFCLVVFMEQLTSLGVDPGDKDSAARYLASLKFERADEKVSEKELKTKSRPLPRHVPI
jgi:hypothetical protein